MLHALGIVGLGSEIKFRHSARNPRPRPTFEMVRTGFVIIALVLLSCLGIKVLGPGHDGFPDSYRVDNARVQSQFPLMTVFPQTSAEVAAVVTHCTSHDLPLTVLSGGHSALGYGVRDSAVVLSTASLDTLEVIDSTLVVGAGLHFAEVYSFLHTRHPDLLLVGGGCPSVGVSGFFLGGGLSFVSRALGVGSDSVLGMEVVLANATVVTLAPGSDLFHGLLAAGGGNYGIVTQFTVALHRKHTAVSSLVIQGSVSALSLAVKEYLVWITSPETSATVGAPLVLGYSGTQAMQVHIDLVEVAATRADAMAAVDTSMAQLLESLIDIPGIEITPNPSHMTYYELESTIGLTDLHGRNAHITSYALYDASVFTEVSRILVQGLADSPGMLSVINIHDQGGVAPVSDSWFPLRGALATVQIKGIWEGSSPEVLHWSRGMSRCIRDLNVTRAYINYIEASDTLDDWGPAYYNAQLPRLAALKAQVDPTAVFDFPHAVHRAVLAPARAFQRAQEGMDAQGAAALFANHGWIEIGDQGRVQGPDAIARAFQAYFDTLDSMAQELLSPMEVQGPLVTYSKRISTVDKQGRDHQITVNSLFNISITDTGALEILSFTGVFI